MAPSRSLRARLSRMVASQEQLESEALQARTASVGATPVAQVEPGEACVLSGVLTSITVYPPGSTHGLDAELFDGTGHVRLVWIGRRQINGIRPGQSLTVEGRLVPGRDMPTLFNPRYSLWPRGAEA